MCCSRDAQRFHCVFFRLDFRKRCESLRLFRDLRLCKLCLTEVKPGLWGFGFGGAPYAAVPGPRYIARASERPKSWMTSTDGKSTGLGP